MTTQPTQQLTDGNFSQLTKSQIMANRTESNTRQNTLFKSSGGAGSYTCPSTYNSTSQNSMMNNVCQMNQNASNVNNSTQKAGKLKKKNKRKNKKRKTKKKSKRRK
jgi:hypothetical protein